MLVAKGGQSSGGACTKLAHSARLDPNGCVLPQLIPCVSAVPEATASSPQKGKISRANQSSRTRRLGTTRPFGAKEAMHPQPFEPHGDFVHSSLDHRRIDWLFEIVSPSVLEEKDPSFRAMIILIVILIVFRCCDCGVLLAGFIDRVAYFTVAAEFCTQRRDT